MGYQAGNYCYATKLEAASVQRWSLGHNSSIVVNGQPALVQYELTDGNTLGYRVYQMPGGTQIAEATLNYAPPECAFLDVNDGLTMGWLVGGALIAAFSLMFLARALRGETGGSYGSS
jgi:hypothetical protein